MKVQSRRKVEFRQGGAESIAARLFRVPEAGRIGTGAGLTCVYWVREDLTGGRLIDDSI